MFRKLMEHRLSKTKMSAFHAWLHRKFPSCNECNLGWAQLHRIHPSIHLYVFRQVDIPKYTSNHARELLLSNKKLVIKKYYNVNISHKLRSHGENSEQKSVGTNLTLIKYIKLVDSLVHKHSTQLSKELQLIYFKKKISLLVCSSKVNPTICQS